MRTVGGRDALAAGMTAGTDSVQYLRDSIPEVYPIGDCVAIKNVVSAIREECRTALII